jgi:hypothetical protein
MLNSDELDEIKHQTTLCAMAMAQTMVAASDTPKVGVLAAMMVAAGGARAMSLDKHTAVDMFLTFYNDATNFITEE